MIKAIFSDIDGTLSAPNRPIPTDIACAIVEILDYVNFGILTAQSISQTQVQLLDPLESCGVTSKQLEHLFLGEAQGTALYTYDSSIEKWSSRYSFNLEEAEIGKIETTICDAVKKCGFENPEGLKGNRTQDRKTQVTFYGLGSEADRRLKIAWDPDGSKRKAIIAEAIKNAPEFEYRVGGTTSIDITKPGMDKSFGIMRMLKELGGTDPSEVIYLCDEAYPGGNDYPIIQTGDYRTRIVSSPKQSLFYLKAFIDACRNCQRTPR